MLEILKIFIEEVIGDKPFLLAGSSYGAYMAIGIAYLMGKQIEGIFLFGPCLIPDSDKRTLPDDIDIFVDKNLIVSLLEEDKKDFKEFIEEAVLVKSNHFNRYRKEILPAYELTNKEFCKKYRSTGYAFTFDEHLSKLVFENPVTVITGRQDDSVGYEDAWNLLKHWPKLTYLSLDCAGHNVQIENPVMFNLQLDDWLKRITSNLTAMKYNELEALLKDNSCL